MPTIEERIYETLCAAEGRLRELIIEAANSGDYEAIDVARTVAAQVREIADDHTSAESNGSKEPAAATEIRNNVRRPTRTQSHRRRKREQYPRFHVKNGVMHKTGWSKKERAEYVHKIPRETYELIVTGIAEASHRGRRDFTSEQLVEQLQSHETSVPVYQIYLTLAFLRMRELVEKKGREGYSATGNLQTSAFKVWSDLERESSRGA